MKKDLTHLYEPRPHKDFESHIRDYIKRYCNKDTPSVKNYKRGGKLVPCHECRGVGQIWRSGDYREEDYYVDCDVCNNTGVLSREQWKELYDKTIENWKHWQKRREERNEIYISAYNKLTEKEREIFGHYANLRY